MNQPTDTPRPPKPDLLLGNRITTASRTIFVDLCENDRGKFVRIREIVAQKAHSVILPIEHLREIAQAIERCNAAAR